MPKQAIRIASRILGVLVFISVAAGICRAADLPPNARLRVEPPITATKFQRTFAARFFTQLNKVVTTDIDRDGDVDVVAATDFGLIVWLNDGSGYLTAQAPGQASGMAGHASDRASGGNDFRRDEPVQDNVPPGSTLTSRVHAPLLAPRSFVPFTNWFVRLDTTACCSAPRAPPA